MNMSVVEDFATYENGADYVLYKISKELMISSKDIRISCSSIKAKTKMLAQRIIDTFCDTNAPLNLDHLCGIEGRYVCVKKLGGGVQWGKVYRDRVETPEEIFEFSDYETGWLAYLHEIKEAAV